MSQTTVRLNPQALIDLADYRREVAEIYRRVRAPELPILDRWQAYRQAREQLLRGHPQSPLTEGQKQAFEGLAYFPYDPALRLSLAVDRDVEPETFEADLDEGQLRYERIGRIRFDVGGKPCHLSLFWITGYGGGLFLPFRDLSNGDQTYGGGRYLIDTIKHADLGHDGSRLIVDFNFAYNPSCAYHPRWICPLAPPENWLQVEISAGEMRFPLAPGPE